MCLCFGDVHPLFDGFNLPQLRGRLELVADQRVIPALCNCNVADVVQNRDLAMLIISGRRRTMREKYVLFDLFAFDVIRLGEVSVDGGRDNILETYR